MLLATPGLPEQEPVTSQGDRRGEAKEQDQNAICEYGSRGGTRYFLAYTKQQQQDEKEGKNGREGGDKATILTARVYTPANKA